MNIVKTASSMIMAAGKIYTGGPQPKVQKQATAESVAKKAKAAGVVVSIMNIGGASQYGAEQMMHVATETGGFYFIARGSI